MPYTVAVSFFDISGLYIAAFPPMRGTISPAPPSAGGADVVVPSAPAPTTFVFTKSPPPGTCSILIVDTASGGDLFRSGPITALPATPGTVSVWIPPSVTVPFSEISSAAPTAPVLSGISAQTTAAGALVSGGVFIPLGMTITGTVASSSLLVTVTGTLTARVWGFFTRTYAFVSTFTAVPTPSGDVLDQSRILRITPTTPTFSASGVPAFIAGRLAPVFARAAASQLESALNATIKLKVNEVLNSFRYRTTSTAVICAQHTAVVPSSGIVLQLLVSDLFGTGVVPLAKHFAVAVQPPPHAGERLSYVAKVTDADTHNPVPSAQATLHNFTVGGGLTTDSLGLTDANGDVGFTTDLRPKNLPIPAYGPGAEEGARAGANYVRVSPSLTLELAGFNPQTVTLLH